MKILNLPQFEVKVKENNIFCLARKKWVKLTPEEWVRQHFLNLLIQYLMYPRGMIKLEQTLLYFKNKKRTDISVFDNEGNIFLIVECKSFKIRINEQTVSQISTYNKILNAKFLSISNGINHYIWKKTSADVFLQMDSFPSYKDFNGSK